MQDEERTTELLDEHLKEEQDRKTANGDDEITEAEREQITRVFKFQQLTKLFYAPDALLEYQAKKEAQAAMQPMDLGDSAEAANRTGS